MTRRMTVTAALIAVVFPALLLALSAQTPAADAQRVSPPKALAAGAGAPPTDAKAGSGGPSMAVVTLECIMPPEAKTGMGGMSKNPFGGSTKKLPFFARNRSPNPVPAGMAIRWTLKGEQAAFMTPKAWHGYHHSGEHRLRRPLDPGRQVKFLDYPPDMISGKIKLAICEVVAGPAGGTPAGTRR